MVPGDWIQEADGTGTMFYHPRDDSGTLRLSVMTFAGRNEEDPKHVLAVSTRNQGRSLERLKNGMWATSWDSEPVESGITLWMKTWVLVAVDKKSVVIASFSYTVAKALAEDPLNVSEIAVADQAVRTCELVYLPSASDEEKLRAQALASG